MCALKLFNKNYSHQKESKPEFVNDNDLVFIVNKLNTHKGDFYINDIDFSIPKGNILSILGTSGSGKTILLRSIAVLEKIDSGSVYN